MSEKPFLTSKDLSRLMTLEFVHDGKLSYVPRGVGASFDVLESNGLIILESESIDSAKVDAHATVAEKGKRIAAAGMMAMIEELER